LQSHFFLDSGVQDIRNKANADLSLSAWQKISWPSKEASLSASQLENFIRCPFVFAAEKVFRLRDIEAFDLDMSAMSKGSLVHALFESLLAEKGRFDRSASEIEMILDELRAQSKDSQYLSPAALAVQKRKYVQIGLRFLNIEREWQKMFSKSQPYLFEKELRFYFDLDSGRIGSEPCENGFLFRGKLDRLDRGQNNEFILIDYKSSPQSSQAHTQWLSEGQIQLLFYMWAIEKEALSELGPKPEVVAAHYYVIKNFRRDYGMQLSDFVGQYFPETEKKTLVISREAKAELLTQFETWMKQLLHLIKNGEFLAKPREASLCKSCHWRTLCRAPHLN